MAEELFGKEARRAAAARGAVEHGSQVANASVEQRGTHKGLSYRVFYEAPKGYWAEGEGEVAGKINKTYFDRIQDAIEHAELEIEGYLD